MWSGRFLFKENDVKYFCTYNSVIVFVPVYVCVCVYVRVRAFVGRGLGLCVLVHEKLQVTDSMVHSAGIQCLDLSVKEKS